MFVKYTLWLALLATLGAAELCTDMNCTCTTITGETVINCQNLDIKKMPPFVKLPKNVIVLDLSKNKLKTIPVLDEIDGLKTLKFSHNDITEIKPDAFKNYNYLLHLDLCHNHVYNLSGLEGLTGLKSLNASHNMIRSLPDNIFLGMAELTELRLNGNPLHYVRYVLFRPLSRVTFLDLSDCALSSLPKDVFHDMMSLDELHLDGNNFEEIPTAGLRSAQSLKALTLNGNQFSTIKANSFKNCKLLETLEISDSGSLESIEAGAFSGLKLLKVLKISHNPNLKKLDFGAFQGLYQSMENEWVLQELLLRENGLREIRSPSTTLCKIKTLDLQGNPWNCDCNLVWITTCEMRDELSSDLTCASPPNLKEKPIRQMGAEDMICLPDESLEHQQKVLRIVVVTSGLVGIIFCGIIIVIIIKKRKIMEWWYYRKRGSGAVYYVKAKSSPQEAKGDI